MSQLVRCSPDADWRCELRDRSVVDEEVRQIECVESGVEELLLVGWVGGRGCGGVGAELAARMKGAESRRSGRCS